MAEGRAPRDDARPTADPQTDPQTTPATTPATTLAALLPGWIESATARRLLAGAETSADVEAAVKRAWDEGDLHHDEGMWWTQPVASEGGATATYWSESPVTGNIARMMQLTDQGRPEEALALSYESTVALVAGAADNPHIEVHLTEVAIATVIALLDAGRVHAAEPVARSAHGEAITREAPLAQGWFAAVLGMTEMTSGRILDARRLLTEARLLARLCNEPRLLGLATVTRSLTYAMVGEAEPHTVAPRFSAASSAQADDGVDEFTRGSAWASADRVHLADLGAAAHAAADDGRHGRAATMAAELAMLGAPDAAQRVIDRLGPLDGDLYPLLVRCVRGLSAADASELAAVAGALEGLGIRGMSAAVTLHAAALVQDRDPELMRSLLREANRRADGLQLGTQFLAQFRRLLPLRAREREIAELASQSLTNKQIADALVLSIRTVENHLYRVYDKLGIEGRDDLVALFSASVR